jgi:hypothetical protein
MVTVMIRIRVQMFTTTVMSLWTSFRHILLWVDLVSQLISLLMPTAESLGRETQRPLMLSLKSQMRQQFSDGVNAGRLL